MTPSPFPDPVADAPAYTRALLELLGDRDPVAEMPHLVPRLRAAISGLGAAELRRPERPGKWSIAEVIQHLADTEIVYGYRVRSVLGADEPPLAPYDQDDWARSMRYQDTDVAAALGELGAMRGANLRLLSGLRDEEWQRVGLHAERGRESIDLITRLLAGHDLVHLAQIERIKKALA
jgi:DinB superfamily